jgi:hypothetical protein
MQLVAWPCSKTFRSSQQLELAVRSHCHAQNAIELQDKVDDKDNVPAG